MVTLPSTIINSILYSETAKRGGTVESWTTCTNGFFLSCVKEKVLIIILIEINIYIIYYKNMDINYLTSETP